MSLKTCSKCGAKMVKEYNNAFCLDCTAPLRVATLSSLGSEDLVTHFKQDVGDRLQRVKWGHFKG